MSKCKFKNIKIVGIKTVIPENYVDIDDELEFFENNPKKLARAKKMVGYGRRYLADKNTTVTDMCCAAAEKLFSELDYDRNEIDALILVNQKPDYREPADACIAHGKLNLKEECVSLDLLLGCSGYPHALFNACTLITSGAAKKCLVLAGDIASYNINKDNRKSVQLFGDACSATIVEFAEDDTELSFVLGTRGKDWGKIVTPMGGIKLPPDKNSFDLIYEDANGNKWNPTQPLMMGEDVFNFTIDVAPKNINEVVELAGWKKEEVGLYALHQANKQIVESIVSIADIPFATTPTETFTKYANNSTNSVVTVLCDQLTKENSSKVVICAFGIGLSWGAVALDLSKTYNGGISTYVAPKNQPTREEQIEHWAKMFGNGKIIQIAPKPSNIASFGGGVLDDAA